jgi:uncharacterized protein YjiS (DUF1127 family)
MIAYPLKDYRRNPMATIVPAVPLTPLALRTVSVSERFFQGVLILELWIDRSRQRRALRELPEYAIRDLALSQADVEAEAGKPFWRP